MNYFNGKKVVKIIKITKGKCDMKMKYKGGNLTGITACYKYVINIISKSLAVCIKNRVICTRALRFPIKKGIVELGVPCSGALFKSANGSLSLQT